MCSCIHAQMQNTCTDQQRLEGESPEAFRHTLSFHTLEGSEDLLDSREAWTDSSKHHILCRHFELKLEAETWKAIPGLCGCSPAPCLARRHRVRNITSHPTAFLQPHAAAPTFPAQCFLVTAVPCSLPPPQVLTGLLSMSLFILHP